MHQSRPRKPRFERVEDSCRLVLTDRDAGILAAVARHRLIQSHHLLRLFPSSPQHLIRRLGRLFHAALLERPVAQRWIKDKIAPSFAYCLARLGWNALRERSSCPVPSLPRLRATGAALSLAHALRLTDVMIALETTALLHNMTLQWPAAWPVLSEEDERQVWRLRWTVLLKRDHSTMRTLLIPDGAFALRSSNGEARYFLLEVDRGTMPVVRRRLFQSSFQRKIMAYKETRRQGVLWQRFQVPAFRVLIVAESRRRLASLQQATAALFKRGDSTMFLFAVADELLAHPDAFNHPWETCSGMQVRPFAEETELSTGTEPNSTVA